MVEDQLRARGISDSRVLGAFERIPRELFVPEEYRRLAYEDHPIPIGCDQTISQPYIVALMVSQLRLKGHERVLEIGTGSGYQTAVLSYLSAEVFSIERIEELSKAAGLRLDQLGLKNAHLEVADGSLGYPACAPYDGIIVSASSAQVPQPLVDELKSPGRMVLPIGPLHAQSLVLVERTKDEIKETLLGECVFVPLIGRHGWAASAN